MAIGEQSKQSARGESGDVIARTASLSQAAERREA